MRPVFVHGPFFFVSRRSEFSRRLFVLWDRYNQFFMQIDWFPLWLSLRVAGISTIIALLTGLAIAYVLANSTFRGRDVLDAIVTLPLVLPPTVLGYYLLVVLGRTTPIGGAYEWISGRPLV